MKETLLTIPITDAFEPKVGCPFCEMRNELETRYLDYVLGAAMMEPDVRIETNAKGFCHYHFGKLSSGGNRLSLALILSTRLETLDKEGLKRGETEKAVKKSIIDKLKPNITDKNDTTERCFVCEKVNIALERTFKTFYITYEKDEAFRKLFAEQEFVCLPHYRVLESGKDKFGEKAKDIREEFLKTLDFLSRERLKSIGADLKIFCDSFDYRNAREPVPENAKTAANRAVEYLTGRKIED